MAAGGLKPAIFLVTAFRAACTAIELLAALHSSPRLYEHTEPVVTRSLARLPVYLIIHSVSAPSPVKYPEIRNLKYGIQC